MRDTFYGEYSYKSGNQRGGMGKAMAVMCAAIAFGLMLSSQLLAYGFGYVRALGAPMTHVYGVPVYGPFLAVRWIPELVQDPDMSRPVSMAALGFTIPFLAGVFFCVRLRRAAKASAKNVHGSARWATMPEIEAAGLCQPPDVGAVVGGVVEKGRLVTLRHAGPEHILAFAPTRSGKGVGLVIPTLLEWPHSTMELDIKGENWQLTAGARAARGHNLIRFDPTGDPHEGHAKYNPLAEIRTGTSAEVGDVQTLVGILADPDGKGIEGDHWRTTASALLVGTMLHAFHDPARGGRTPTLPEIDAILSQQEEEYAETFLKMVEITYADPQIQEIIHRAANDQIARDPREGSGVLSTAKKFLALYRDPIVAKNTSESTFRLRDIMNADAPTSLYLVLKPSSMQRLIPFVRILLTQFIYTQTDVPIKTTGGRTHSPHKHPCLMLLDEFPQLGRMPILEKAMAFTAGWGIKFYLIAQDVTQIRAAYGKDESILSNCHLKIAYATANLETAEMLSKMTGTTTVLKKNVSVSRRGGRGLLAQRDYTESHSEIQRPLLTADECAKIPGAVKDPSGDIVEAGDMLIFPAGHHAIYGKQVLFFQDPKYLEQTKRLPPTQSTDFRAPWQDGTRSCAKQPC